MSAPSQPASTKLSWRAVKPNLPVAGRAPAEGPMPLHFLATPARPGRRAEDDDAPPTLLQAAGPLLVEVPLADDLPSPLPALSFLALRRA